MKRMLLILVVLLLFATPTFALFAPEPDEQAQEREEVPLGIGLLTVAGITGLMVFIKKEKRFMRKHVFRFEKIKKKHREEDYEN